MSNWVRLCVGQILITDWIMSVVEYIYWEFANNSKKLQKPSPCLRSPVYFIVVVATLKHLYTYYKVLIENDCSVGCHMLLNWAVWRYFVHFVPISDRFAIYLESVTGLWLSLGTHKKPSGHIKRSLTRLDNCRVSSTSIQEWLTTKVTKLLLDS